MISKKDIDPKWVKFIEDNINDINTIKDYISTLNENDGIIEKNADLKIKNLQDNVTKSINEVVNTLNKLIDTEKTDVESIYEQISKLVELVDKKDRDNRDLIDKITTKIDEFIEKFKNIEGYIKVSGGNIKGINLPEDRIFDVNFRKETIKEVIKEQPIIQEVEKEIIPTLSKSQLEHYYDYGIKLSGEVLTPKYIKGYQKLQVDGNQEEYYKTNKKIVLFRFIKNLLLIFLDDGTIEITNTTKGTVIYKGNVIS